jgi:hypothetical protein
MNIASNWAPSENPALKYVVAKNNKREKMLKNSTKFFEKWFQFANATFPVQTKSP